MTSSRASAVLLVACLAVAGCGGGEVSTESYERELRDTMEELEAAYGDVAANGAGTLGTRATPAQLAQQVDALEESQVALRDAANRLRDIEAPSDLEDEHADLVAGVRDMADAVDVLVEAHQVANSDPSRASELAREFAADDSFGTVEAAARALAEAGVDAGL